MKSPADRRWIYAEIDAGPDAAGPIGADWLAVSVDRLLMPHIRRLSERIGRNPTFDVFGEYTDGRRFRRTGNALRDWDHLLRGIGDGAIATAMISATVQAFDDGETIAVANASLGPAGLHKLLERKQLSCALLRGTIAEELPQDVVQQWRRLLLDTARDLMPDQGWLTVDFYGCAYERRYGGSVVSGLKDAARWLRTYAWGTLLGDSLVGQLGGLDSVLAAPIEAIDFSTEQSDLVYLQLSGSPDVPAGRELSQLADFLGPVLRPPSAGRIYAGPELALAGE